MGLVELRERKEREKGARLAVLMIEPPLGFLSIASMAYLQPHQTPFKLLQRRDDQVRTVEAAERKFSVHC